MITDKEIETGIAAYLKQVKGSAGPMDLYREAARLGFEAAIARPEGTGGKLLDLAKQLPLCTTDPTHSGCILYYENERTGVTWDWCAVNESCLLGCVRRECSPQTRDGA